MVIHFSGKGEVMLMRRCNGRVVTVLAVNATLTFTASAAPVPRFTGLLQTFQPRSPSIQTSALADMTPDGPVAGTLRPLGRDLSDIAVDPNGSFYGDVRQDVYQIDRVTLQATLMNVSGTGIADPSWPIGLTFDTQRSRVILATLGGTGFLFAYSPLTAQWSLIRDLGNVDLQSIVYRPSNDTLYGIENNSQADPITALYRYSPSGVFLGTLPLSSRIPGAPGSIGDSNYQLLLANDGRLALLTPPVPDPITASLSPRLYLINADDGVISYDGKFPAPEPAMPAVMLVGVVTVASRTARRAAVAGIALESVA